MIYVVYGYDPGGGKYHALAVAENEYMLECRIQEIRGHYIVKQFDEESGQDVMRGYRSIPNIEHTESAYLPQFIGKVAA